MTRKVWMPYRFIEEIATADVAFEAWGESLEEVFSAACEATLAVMVERPQTLREEATVPVKLQNREIDLLLFDFLNELVYLKDARLLLLRAKEMRIEGGEGNWRLSGTLVGEKLDQEKHVLVVDVKAVTLHMFFLRREDDLWRARVVLDI